MLVGGEAGAERGFRATIAAGETGAWIPLGELLAGRPGREDDAEAAFGEALKAGHSGAWIGLGNVLAAQPVGDAEATARRWRRAMRKHG